MSEIKTSTGQGRLIVAIYAIFALSATARSLYQLFTKFGEAPFSYSLSAVSALVYVVATIALARSLNSLAKFALVFELLGVLIVGTLSVAIPDNFQQTTVWSFFGGGYGFVPLILPIWGLWWMQTRGRTY
jgi:hypothetical protein